MEDEKDGDTERFSTKVLPLSSDSIPAYGALASVYLLPKFQLSDVQLRIIGQYHRWSKTYI
jgi:hypothetical protein